MTTLRFGGKVGVVAGAASGLGAAVAQKLHEEGATVVAAGKKAFTSELFITVACDVADDAEVCELFDTCR
jgi:NAD(P)-dependent dehydrogenase (short-subunit alcohol dehydrogenase family)